MKSFNFDNQYTNRVINYLTQNYAAVMRKVWNSEHGIMAIFIHEEYVFRTGTYQTLTTIVESREDWGQATLFAVGSGGGGGICNFNWGSQSAAEDTVIKNVRDLIEHDSRRYDSDYWLES